MVLPRMFLAIEKMILSNRNVALEKAISLISNGENRHVVQNQTYKD